MSNVIFCVRYAVYGAIVRCIARWNVGRGVDRTVQFNRGVLREKYCERNVDSMIENNKCYNGRWERIGKIMAIREFSEEIQNNVMAENCSLMFGVF